MYDGRWHDGWGGGGYWWVLLMVITMAIFWVGLLALAFAVFRREGHAGVGGPLGRPVPPPPPPPRPAPEEILAERLARGEIDTDEYRRRLDALRHGR